MLLENGKLAGFDSVVESFSENDRIAICHDLDADGVCSGAITYLAIQKLRGRAPELVITQGYKTVELLPASIGLLKKGKITKLITVDFALDQKADSIGGAEKFVGQILVIDHHKDYLHKSGPKTFIIKPQHVSDVEPSRYPCAKFCYDLFSRHVDLGAHSWVAAAGLIGDNQLLVWNDFAEAAAKEHGSDVKQITKVAFIISAVEVLAPEKLNALLLFIAKAEHPQEVVESGYSKYLLKLESGVKKLMEEFGERKEIYPEIGLIWFEFSTKSNFKSALINRASNELFPNWTLIFLQNKGDGYVSFSCRRQDFKVRTNELLETAVEGFENAGAGGHIPASAGRIMERDLPRFKEKIIKLLNDGQGRA